jgi:hypothetical protein
MDTFDVADAQQAPSSRRSSAVVWNVLTILVLLITLCLAAVIMMLFINPNSSFNPFPPPTEIVILPTPTPSHTPRVVFQPSWTPTLTTAVEEIPTNTPRPSATPFMTETPFGMASLTPTRTFTPAPYNFAIQQGSPVAIPNVFYLDLGCNWSGVGGQVLDMSGGPVVGLTVRLKGTVSGQPVDLTTLTGVNQAYGDGGFEFKIADAPVDSTGTLYIQLFDQADLPMSDTIYFDTFNDCQKNLIVINIVQVK